MISKSSNLFLPPFEDEAGFAGGWAKAVGDVASIIEMTINGPTHLFIVIVQPGNIGPYASADRVWSERFWILYVLLLVTVHLHAGIGMYRLAMKWIPPSRGNTAAARARLKVAMWCIVIFFLCLGSASLLTYMKIGYEHADRAGERYLPSSATMIREAD